MGRGQRKRLAGATVWLVMRGFEGDEPLPDEGDFFRTSTGRCYLIEFRRLAQQGAGYVARYRCRVLGDDAVKPGEPGVYAWSWAPRTTR